MKVSADVTYSGTVEFEMPDTASQEDIYDMAVEKAIDKFLQCGIDDLDIDIDICGAETEYYGELQ